MIQLLWMPLPYEVTHTPRLNLRGREDASEKGYMSIVLIFKALALNMSTIQ